MKKEYKEIITKAIKESELNGYKWSVKGDTLNWSYLTVEYFKFEIGEETEVGEKFLRVRYVLPHLNTEETFVYLLIGNEFYHDAKTIEDALAIATKATINKANRLF